MIEIITKFDIGQVANLKTEERMSYEASLKQKRDWESVLATVRRAGLTLGRKEGIQEGIEKERARAEAEKIAEKRAVAREMKKDGLSLEQISRFTKLSIEEINKL